MMTPISDRYIAVLQYVGTELGFPTDDLISQFHDIIEDIQEMANEINVIFSPALLKAPLRVVK